MMDDGGKVLEEEIEVGLSLGTEINDECTTKNLMAQRKLQILFDLMFLFQ